MKEAQNDAIQLASFCVSFLCIFFNNYGSQLSYSLNGK